MFVVERIPGWVVWIRYSLHCALYSNYRGRVKDTEHEGYIWSWTDILGSLSWPWRGKVIIVACLCIGLEIDDEM